MQGIRAKFGMRQKTGNEQRFRLFSVETIRDFVPGGAPADNFRHRQKMVLGRVCGPPIATGRSLETDLRGNRIDSERWMPALARKRAPGCLSRHQESYVAGVTSCRRLRRS